MHKLATNTAHRQERIIFPIIMASKHLLSLSPRYPNGALSQQIKRQARRGMGTLAYQYLQSQHQEATRATQSWSSPETAFGAIHVAERMSFASPESDFTAAWVRDAVNLNQESSGRLHSAHLYSYASPESDFVAARVPDAVHQPETAYGSIHAAELLSFASPESDFTSAYVPDAVNRPVSQPKPFDAEFLLSSPLSASGYMHAAEVMADEMKAEILAARGVESASGSQQRDVLFQEFIATMALMASPESATGFVPSAMYLDEESQALLFKIQHQADDLPKTLQEALTDPRAAVITEAVHPFSIVDVNDAWVGLCGYTREEALQQDIGKLLQGPETNHQVARTIVPQLMQEHFADVVLTNYTKQGQRFENKLKAGLISDEQGTKYFVGVFEALLFESSEGEKMMATA